MKKHEFEIWPTMQGCFIHDLFDEAFIMGPYRTGYEAHKAMEKLIVDLDKPDDK